MANAKQKLSKDEQRKKNAEARRRQRAAAKKRATEGTSPAPQEQATAASETAKPAAKAKEPAAKAKPKATGDKAFVGLKLNTREDMALVEFSLRLTLATLNADEPKAVAMRKLADRIGGKL